MQKFHRSGYRRNGSFFRSAEPFRTGRQLERKTRIRTLAFARWAHRCGWSWGAIAGILGLTAKTLKNWQLAWDEDRLALAPLGSTGFCLSPLLRETIMQQILLSGPGIGHRALFRIFPEVPRRILLMILIQARENDHEEQRTRDYQEILWFRAGATWAIDYTKPKGNPIDGDKRWILTVRDLASGCILLFEACEHADARTTVFHLRRLILLYGAPLVLKADNGSHFTADLVTALLQEFDITPLFSPIYTPTYNGSVEADQGSLKSRAGQLAARDGSPDDWTSSHLEGALLWRNRTVPRGRDHDLPTPEHRFDHRRPITNQERVHFKFLVECELKSIATTAQQALRERQQHAATQAQQPELDAPAGADSLPSDALHRRAVAAAMKTVGLFTTRRCMVRLPDSRKN